MVRLHTLGRFDLVTDPGPATPIVIQPKRLVLLAYLVAAVPRGFHRRDTLLGLLWPNLGPMQGRRALRQALHYLRQQVGEETITTLSDDRIGLAGSLLTSDVQALEDAASAGRPQEVLGLYGGAFLEGVFIPDVTAEFDDWVTRTRQRYAAIAAKAAWACCDQFAEAGDGVAAVAAARQAHDLSPNDEPGLRRLLEVMRRFSDRAGVLEVYQAFERRLHEEYDGCPSMQTIRIVEQVRTRTAPAGPFQ